MSLRHFFLVLLISLIGSAGPAKSSKVKASAPPIIGKFRSGKEFYKIFVSVKVGQSKEQVQKLLGAPTKIEGEVWTYFENRAPKAGEVLNEYQIVFLNGKVRKILVN